MDGKPSLALLARPLPPQAPGTQGILLGSQRYGPPAKHGPLPIPPPGGDNGIGGVREAARPSASLTGGYPSEWWPAAEPCRPVPAPLLTTPGAAPAITSQQTLVTEPYAGDTLVRKRTLGLAQPGHIAAHMRLADHHPWVPCRPGQSPYMRGQVGVS